MAEPILELRDVSKTFRQRGGLFSEHRALRTRAVDGVSWAIGAGERVGLVGESGSGKSTLAKLLVGLLAPDVGTVRWKGAPVARMSRAQRLAMARSVQFVFQDPLTSLNPRLTVGETLEEPLIIHGVGATKGARAKVVASLLEQVRLPVVYVRRVPRELSGGERQRVGIARALALSPDLVICDEPIASLDLSVGVHILELLRELSATRTMALLFISHDLRAIAAVCERVTVLQAGRVVEAGTAHEVLSRPREAYTRTLVRSARLELDPAPRAGA